MDAGPLRASTSCLAVSTTAFFRTTLPEECTVAEVGRFVLPQDPLLARTGMSATGQVTVMPAPARMSAL